MDVPTMQSCHRKSEARMNSRYMAALAGLGSRGMAVGVDMAQRPDYTAFGQILKQQIVDDISATPEETAIATRKRRNQRKRERRARKRNR